VAKNLAAALYSVHELGHLIGDFKPDNVMVDPKSGLATIVDTDSFHITGGQGWVFRCVVATPAYSAPELHGMDFSSAQLPTFTEETDRFALAVLIFHLLMNGASPFACSMTPGMTGSLGAFQPVENIKKGFCPYFPNSSTPNHVAIPPYAPEIDTLPPDLRQLFKRAFIDGHKQMGLRPGPKEWFDVLGVLENSIKTCSANKEHLYYAQNPYCPWCSVEGKLRNMAGGTAGGRQNIAQSPFAPPVNWQPQTSAPQQAYRPSIPSSPQSQPVSKPQFPSTVKKSQLGTALRLVLLIVAVYFGYSFFSGNSSAKVVQPPRDDIIPKRQIGHITGTNVYLRPGPARKGGKGGKDFLQPNYEVEILGAKDMSDGRWLNVKYNGRVGWVFAEFVSVNSGNGVNTPPKPEAPKPVKPVPNNKKQQAMKYVKEGEDSWKKADWSKAYEAFSKAYEIYPDPQTKVKRDNANANVQAVKKEAETKKQAAAAEARRRREREEAKQRAEAEASEAERLRQEELALRKQKENEALRKIVELGFQIGGEALKKELAR
jgi:serine/threonine protein kinase